MSEKFSNGPVLPEKKLSQMTNEESVRAVEQGLKPIADVSSKFETDLPFIEFEIPTLTLDIYGNKRVVTEVKLGKKYIYYRPDSQMKAYRLKQLLLKSTEGWLKLKPGDVVGSTKETESYHREFGELVGYSDEEIDEFIDRMRREGEIRKD